MLLVNRGFELKPSEGDRLGFYEFLTFDKRPSELRNEPISLVVLRLFLNDAFSFFISTLSRSGIFCWDPLTRPDCIINLEPRLNYSRLFWSIKEEKIGWTMSFSASFNKV